MTDDDERFLERLSRAPAGLLLGQHHLALGKHRDDWPHHAPGAAG
jgi:hypothetical protein